MVSVAELIVVTGPPGAGKTTAARALSGLFERSALVAGDDFFAFVDQGYVAPWTREAHQQNDIVIGAAAAAAGRLAAGGYTVVFDGVIGPWFLEAFAAATGLGAVHYVVLLPPEPTCVERVRSRVGHGFADLDATRHMYRQFACADVATRHVLGTTDDVETVASRIFGLVQDGAALWSLRHQPCRSA
jgi:adenylate kinase family enzyme